MKTLQIDTKTDRDGQTVNLGSGWETSVLELASAVCEAAGRPDLQPDFRAARPGDVLRHCADATLAPRQTLDFQLRIDLQTGIARTLEHIRRQSTSPAELLAQIEDANWTLGGERRGRDLECQAQLRFRP